VTAALDNPGVRLTADGLIALRPLAAQIAGDPALARLPGGFVTRRKGHGQEVADVRLYAEGDDVRHLDRGTTARTGALHVRQFQEERDRETLLVADFRPSMLWGISRCFRSVAAAEIFRDGMARLTGIGPQDFTISERHLKVYDEAADPWPAPHKDRNASHFSIGLPVVLPEGSSVCVFPDLEPGPNTEERAVFLSPPPGGTARDIYRSARAEILNERLGDMVVFLGSALFHERVNGAGTSVLYIKVNGRGEDPLGENIYAGNPAYAHA